jgi:hypothetical protein
MKTFTVYVPCTLSISFKVEAEDCKDAIDKALQTELTVQVIDEHRNNVDIEDFDMHEYITKGNVFYGGQNKIEVEEDEIEVEEVI